MFKNRIPSLKLISPVYGIVTLFFSGWSLYWFFWNLPAWLLFQTIGETMTVFFYTMTVNFMESLVLLGTLLIIGALLPAKWFRDDFVFMGTLTVIASLGYLMYVALQGSGLGTLRYASVIPVFVLFGRFAGDRLPKLRTIIEDVADRSVVFLYFLLPVCLLSTFITGIRNLF